MSKKLCKDCKHVKGITFDFWCGEGHTEYEVLGGETNCPYYEYHNWSMGTPSETKKRYGKDNLLTICKNLKKMGFIADIEEHKHSIQILIK